LQPGLDSLHSILGHRDSFLIDRSAEFDDGMNAFPSHTLGPLQHRLGIGQLGAVPVLFQDSPAAFHGVVLAVVRRIVEEADGLADVIGELDHAFEKLRAPAIALWSVVGLDLDVCDASTLLRGLTLPPRVEAVDDEIAGLRRAPEGQMKGATVFVDDTKRRVFFLAPHVVVGRLVVTPRLASARVVANIHRRLAVHAQAHDGFALAISVMFPDVGEDGVGFGDFFWGLALSTGRSRYPLRFNTSDMPLREGSTSSANPSARNCLMASSAVKRVNDKVVRKVGSCWA
jgi:hypothetical protein